MARRKTLALTGTAIVPVPPSTREINPDRKYDPANPHSWLSLLADDASATDLRVMWGVLRASDHGHDNSAAAFVTAKLRPSWSSDEQAMTAAWAEALAPADADDSFADPVLFAQRIDREIGRDVERATPLLAYATITDPQSCRIHVFREELRRVARELVGAYGGPVIAVIHAPGRVGSANPLHGHLCLSPYTVDGPLGFGPRIAPFCNDKGRKIILDAWRNRQRFG